MAANKQRVNGGRGIDEIGRSGRDRLAAMSAAAASRQTGRGKFVTLM